jgi:hypothetical protein
MPIDSKHPSFTSKVEDWQLTRIAYAGETAVKAAGPVYLPPTPSMVLDGFRNTGTQVTVETELGYGYKIVPHAATPVGTMNKGEAAYYGYKTRAVFHEFFGDAVKYFVGMLNQRQASIEVPEGMEPLVDKMTNQGESAYALLRKIHTEQLTTGRLGLLLDIPKEPDEKEPMPFVALYCGENAINWDDSADNIGVNSLNLVVLDESGARRNAEYEWDRVEQFRILEMRPRDELPAAAGVVTQPTAKNLIYAQAVVTAERGAGKNIPPPEQFTVPVFRGKALEEIPFVFVNACDITSEVDFPPLIALARLCMAIYRLEADYRQALYMQGQDTLVTIGSLFDADGNATTGEDSLRTGAGARIGVQVGGDAKYIGVNSQGLPELRQAVAADKKAAETKSGQFIAPDAGKQESGDALGTRLSAQTASLQQIAKTSALAMQNVLRKAAIWMGKDPNKVIVKPNLEFVDKALVARELVDMLTARTLGAPLSLQSVHELIVKRGMSEKTFEEELRLIEQEDMERVKKMAKEFALIPEGAPGGLPAPKPEPPPTPK